MEYGPEGSSSTDILQTSTSDTMGQYSTIKGITFRVDLINTQYGSLGIILLSYIISMNYFRHFELHKRERKCYNWGQRVNWQAPQDIKN